MGRQSAAPGKPFVLLSNAKSVGLPVYLLIAKRQKKDSSPQALPKHTLFLSPLLSGKNYFYKILFPASFPHHVKCPISFMIVRKSGKCPYKKLGIFLQLFTLAITLFRYLPIIAYLNLRERNTNIAKPCQDNFVKNNVPDRNTEASTQDDCPFHQSIHNAASRRLSLWNGTSGFSLTQCIRVGKTTINPQRTIKSAIVPQPQCRGL